MRNVRLMATLVFFHGIAFVRADTSTGSTGGNAAVENRQPTLATRYMIAVQGLFPDNAASTPSQSVPPDRTQPFLGEIKPVPFDFLPSGWMLCEGQSLSIGQNNGLFSLLGFSYGGNGTSTFNLPDLRGRIPLGVGQGSGLPNYQLGDVAGTNSLVLSVANLPAHTHTYPGGETGPAGNATPLDNRQPSLGFNFLIAANGEIMIVAWSLEPTGWCHCDGRLLSASTHSYLFSHLGTTYGGNSSNFAIPDLRGRAVLGDDNGGSWPRGAQYGTNSAVLTLSDMAAHTHTIPSGNTDSAGGTGNGANNYQPSLVLRWLIAFSGFYPTAGNSVTFPMVGEIRLIAGSTAGGLSSSQWKLLDGGLYGIAQNSNLYSLIGGVWGGNNQSTFAVPDLRARVDAGAGPGLSFSSFVGSQTLNISVAQLAAHAHALLALTVTGLQHFSDGSAKITLEGTLGTSCQVDKSDTLPAAWSSLGTVNFGTATQTITDPNPTHELHRFYKAHSP